LAGVCRRIGLLWIVDILDEDSYLIEHGPEGEVACRQAAERAQARLAEIPGDTSVLAGIVAGLAARTS
jgi:hypothetical protein